jgi:hypothetical protein
VRTKLRKKQALSAFLTEILFNKKDISLSIGISTLPGPEVRTLASLTPYEESKPGSVSPSLPASVDYTHWIYLIKTK